MSFLRQNYIINKSDAANTLYKISDKNSIIECELIVYGLDYIVHTALHNKCMLKNIFFSFKIILFSIIFATSSSYLRSSIELVNKKTRFTICITFIKKKIIIIIVLDYIIKDS